MRFLHCLISVAISAGLLLLGWFLTADFFGVKYPFGEFLFSAPAGRLALGVAFIIAVVAYWLTAFKPSSRARSDERFISFESDGGMVRVSVRAVNDFLIRLGREFAGIVNLRSDIVGSVGQSVQIRLDLTVKSGVKIQELAQLLQLRVRESLRESLGISDVAEVKISVTEIVAAQENNRPERDDWQNNTM